MPQRVLLTGSTGFVGPHVARALADAGYDLRALARSGQRARPLIELGAEIITAGLEQRDALARACEDVDIVVHMAALTHARSESEYRRINVDGTRSLLDAALAATARPRRFVFLSSLAAVGPCIDGRPVHSDDPPRPLTAYGRSKLAGEDVCLDRADRIEVVILRAPAVYGPRDTDLLHFFRIAQRGLLPVPTGPARPLQMVHVADLARALVRAVAAPAAAGLYHIADERVYAWEQVGRMVGDAVGRRVRVVRIPGPLIAGLAGLTEAAAAAVGRSVIFNRDKARELLAPGWLCETESARARLGFQARIPLAEGLRETADWYRREGWL
jgi:nucleoside-diphosphate-sugar epimerase